MFHLYKVLYKKGIAGLLLIGVIFPTIFSLLITILDLLYPNVLSSNDNYDPLSIIKENPLLLFSVIIISPVLETAIQYIPVKIFSYSKYKYANSASIIISALIFALLHKWELLYFISLFFAGFIWASICFTLIRRKFYPYLYIAIIHALYNAIILSLDYFFFDYK